ncbi:MFS transporter [Streptomyces sp. NPDC094143]|uniref:MFS transporter n=1 Tax=Streptomyces sp. NPDC094143 TaxID=3155310 RepID=UPI003323ED54
MPHSTTQPATGWSAPARRPRARLAAPLYLSSVLITFVAASSAPTPLYQVYEAEWGLTSATLTVVYSVYCISVLASLLVTGSLSDHLGRRPVICGALVLEAVSMVVFLQAEGAGALILARVLQGLATGAATSALGAALLDVAPQRGTVVISLAPLLGMSAGTLGASLTLHLLPSVRGTAYALLLAALLVQLTGLLALPESGRRKSGAVASLRPRPRVPALARTTLWRVSPLFVAIWSLGGFYLSLGPALTGLAMGPGSAARDGLIVCVLTVCAVAAVAFTRTMAAEHVIVLGASLLSTGVALTLAAAAGRSGPLFLAGTALAGLGFGPAFQAGLRLVTSRVAPHQRGGLMASVYVVTYLAMSVPVLAAGVLVERYGLLDGALCLAAFVVVLALLPLTTRHTRVAPVRGDTGANPQTLGEPVHREATADLAR